MNEMKTKLKNIFHSLKPGENTCFLFFLFKDDLGCCTLMINLVVNFSFGRLRIYNEKGNLRFLDKRPFIYEYAFSSRNDDLDKYESKIWNKLQSFMTKMEDKKKFMIGMGFEVMGYGTYQFNGLVFRREGRYDGIEIQSKGFGKLIMRTDSSSLNDMDFALRWYGEDPERFMNLPSEARDHVLKSGKLNELAWNS